jgi:hypothetical protein
MSLTKSIIAVVLFLSTMTVKGQWLPSGATSGPIYYNGGNVGIGTSTPDTKLSIEGNGMWQLRLKDTGGGQDWRIGSTGTSWNSGAGKFIITNAVNSDNPAIIIDAERRVGIGTTSPDAKLAVKGTIHTQEVKVDLQGAVAPDYVFEKEYRLRSLADIEHYITENKHLPEVPSAKQMEEEGLHLKEMNLLLLKKVEELTLYVIELKKESDAQQKRIDAQQKEIEILKEK